MRDWIDGDGGFGGVVCQSGRKNVGEQGFSADGDWERRLGVSVYVIGTYVDTVP